jgi:hypothetical protein
MPWLSLVFQMLRIEAMSLLTSRNLSEHVKKLTLISFDWAICRILSIAFLAPYRDCPILMVTLLYNLILFSWWLSRFKKKWIKVKLKL